MKKKHQTFAHLLIGPFNHVPLSNPDHPKTIKISTLTPQKTTQMHSDTEAPTHFHTVSTSSSRIQLILDLMRNFTPFLLPNCVLRSISTHSSPQQFWTLLRSPLVHVQRLMTFMFKVVKSWSRYPIGGNFDAPVGRLRKHMKGCVYYTSARQLCIPYPSIL